MPYTQIIKHIKKLNADNDGALLHVQRLVNIKVQHLEQDFALLTTYIKEKRSADDILVHIYYILSEDIIRNLRFDFPHNETHSYIIKLFRQLQQTLADLNVRSTFKWIAMAKCVFVDADIKLFYNENKVFFGDYHGTDRHVPAEVQRALQLGYDWCDQQYYHHRMSKPVEEMPKMVLQQLDTLAESCKDRPEANGLQRVLDDLRRAFGA